jgi:ketosteroid isomerase-like protein
VPPLHNLPAIMLRLLALIAVFVAAVPSLSAQSAADSALVARIYTDLARGDVAPVLAMLDDHVLWIEGPHSPQAGRHFGPGSVAALVLQPQVTAGIAYEPELITTTRGRIVVVGTTRWSDSATGLLEASGFHHVWLLRDGRVVSVDRCESGPDAPAADQLVMSHCKP